MCAAKTFIRCREVGGGEGGGGLGASEAACVGDIIKIKENLLPSQCKKMRHVVIQSQTRVESWSWTGALLCYNNRPENTDD